MGAPEKTTASDTQQQRDASHNGGLADEIYTPIEAAIDREAERTVCSRECPPGKKPIVSVHGEDIDPESLPDDAERAA